MMKLCKCKKKEIDALDSDYVDSLSEQVEKVIDRDCWCYENVSKRVDEVGKEISKAGVSFKTYSDGKSADSIEITLKNWNKVKDSDHLTKMVHHPIVHGETVTLVLKDGHGNGDLGNEDFFYIPALHEDNKLSDLMFNPGLVVDKDGNLPVKYNTSYPENISVPVSEKKEVRNLDCPNKCTAVEAVERGCIYCANKAVYKSKQGQSACEHTLENYLTQYFPQVSTVGTMYLLPLWCCTKCGLVTCKNPNE